MVFGTIKLLKFYNMPACVVKHCKNNSSQVYAEDKKITFHRFPKDKITRQKWIDILRVSRGEADWNGSNYCLICSEHFKEESRYVTKRGMNCICKHAVPTENLDSPIVKIEVAVPELTGENGNENNHNANLDIEADSKREALTPICDIEPSLSLSDTDLPDIDYLTDSSLSLSDIDLLDPYSDILKTPDSETESTGSISPTPQSEIDQQVPLCEIEPSAENWGDTDKLIPHLDIESTTFSEMDLPKCLKINPQHTQNKYLVVRPPSQDPDIQYMDICLKRQVRKYKEFKRLWRHKLQLCRLRIWRLTRSNARLNSILENR